VESTIEDNDKICHVDENPILIQNVFSFRFVYLNHFGQKTNAMVQVPNHHLFHPKCFPIKALHSSLLTPTKRPQTFLSTIVVKFFSCTSDLSTITSGTMMRGAISKEET
jgi:hypothetical protein